MKKAFTLLELIIVVIILGILVSIALPRFQATREKARVTEGLQILGAIRNSQIRYYHNTLNRPSGPSYAGPAGDYAFLTNCGLDIVVPTSRFFDTIYCAGTNKTQGTTTNILGAVLRAVNVNSEFGQYFLFINLDGKVVCSEFVSGTCARLGFPTP